MMILLLENEMMILLLENDYSCDRLFQYFGHRVKAKARHDAIRHTFDLSKTASSAAMAFTAAARGGAAVTYSNPLTGNSDDEAEPGDPVVAGRGPSVEVEIDQFSSVDG